MKIQKIFQYAYLVLAALFIYDAISKYNATGELSYTSLLFTVLAIFMFFFRKRFNKRFENRDNSN